MLIVIFSNTGQKGMRMFRKIGLPLIALIGIACTLFMIYRGRQTPKTAPLKTTIARLPFTNYVAGEGLIESIHDNREIGVPFPNIVTDVFVESGDRVHKNQPLFKLDTRQIDADIAQAQAACQVAQAKLALHTKNFSYYEKLTTKQAVSKQEYTNARFQKIIAHKEFIAAQKEIERLDMMRHRSIICSPIDGMVLQSHVHAGESANINSFEQKTLMLIGNTESLQLRANIAEEDAWKVTHGAPAIAFIRSNHAHAIPLKFSFIEPYIIPKQSLTGSDFERVDTRVLQVVYTFEKNDMPLYAGQLLDVYIQVKPSMSNA